VKQVSAKYYTQFIIQEIGSVEGKEFSGVIVLSRAVDEGSARRDIECVLARNFDLAIGEVTLVEWHRIH
jgi:hypothetical protein